MTTERIDIQVREDGSRVVRRNLEDIASSADRVERAVNVMRNTLRGIGVGLLIKQTYGLIEEFQKLQNRLGAVGLEGTRLSNVYKTLNTVANDTRSSLKGTVELYSRLALSTRELGVGESQLIQFTKSLNQAILLSGASAKEAENGLIQLSQGMASNRLSGDELRSVLEQLPIVADVIAKRMGVTRGELRKLGAEGKITADIILDAFKDAAEGLDQRFKHLTPTISQAFQILRNNLITAVGELATATGIIPGIANSVKLLADNLVFVAKAITIAAAAWAAWKFSALISNLMRVTVVTDALGMAIKTTTGFQALWITITGGLTTAWRALTAAMAANPFGALAIAIASVTTALILNRKEVGKYAENLLGTLEPLEKIDFELSLVDKAMTKSWFTKPTKYLGKTKAELLEIRKELELQKLVLEHLERPNSGPLTGRVGRGGQRMNKDYALPQTEKQIDAQKGLIANLKEQIALFDNSKKAAEVAYPIQLGTFGPLDAAQKKYILGLASEYDALVKNKKLKEDALDAAKDQLKIQEDNKKDYDSFIDSLNSLRSAYDEGFAAQAKYDAELQILNLGFLYGKVKIEEYDRTLAEMNATLEAAKNPKKVILDQYNQELKLLGMTSDEREVAIQILNMELDAKQRHIRYSDTEIAQWKERLRLYQEESRLASIRDNLLDDSVNKRRQEAEQFTQIQKLLDDSKSGFSKNDAVNALSQTNPNLFDGTQELINARLQSYQEMYSKIDAWRQQELISERTAQAMKVRIWMQSQSEQLSVAKDFFGGLAELQSSKSKEMSRIGRAAAIVNATIKTYESAVNAYASASSIPYVGYILGPIAAAGAIAAGLANVQAIRNQPAGFMEGGYTGGIPRTAVAGVVHGQEHVMNASATQRIGVANLEALRRGTADVVPKNSKGGGVNITIENYGTSKEFEVQQLSPTEIRMIARDEAKNQVDRRASKAAAASLRNPNSELSRSVGQNTTAGRRR